MKVLRSTKRLLVIPVVLAVTLLVGAASRVLGDCGPFTDVSFFCAPILELYYLGITGGTSPTTYAPNQTTTRGEIAAFVSRSFNQSIKRSSRRAALGQWWTPQNERSLGRTTVGIGPAGCVFDGADVWVANFHGGSVSRVRASDGRLLDTWSALFPVDVLVAMGRVVLVGPSDPGNLFLIEPAQPAGVATTVAGNLGGFPQEMAFDGSRIWTANSGGSVSIVTPGPTVPWSVTTLATGFLEPHGILYDGGNIWVTDGAANALLKLDSSGAILQTVPVGNSPARPIFDGSNIWVPNPLSESVTVVRASTGAVLTTLTGNVLVNPGFAAFDGERVLIGSPGGDGVSLWRAADLAPLGFLSTGAGSTPYGACSDGLNFWIPLLGSSQLARFGGQENETLQIRQTVPDRSRHPDGDTPGRRGELGARRLRPVHRRVVLLLADPGAVLPRDHGRDVADDLRSEPDYDAGRDRRLHSPILQPVDQTLEPPRVARTVVDASGTQ
jgi:S-layer homology domain